MADGLICGKPFETIVEDLLHAVDGPAVDGARHAPLPDFTPANDRWMRLRAIRTLVD